ncbi:hypothetical protein E3V39_05110 [Gammaproteobacteria bacterium LSUCC0112]|nr:hypothetical protein E3V39_05110 [Gammaproteobacteria bacterium LSUCC0112]
MSLYQDVTNKPWDQVGLPDGIESKPVFAVSNERLALTVFMIIASVVFSLLVVSYYIRMNIGDWVPMSIPTQVWLNTALLVLSSVFMQGAVFVSHKQLSVSLYSGAGLLFGIGGLFAIAFVAGQYQVWGLLADTGQGIRSNPANSFFYLLTSVHVAHLGGGLWVWSKSAIRLTHAATSDHFHQTFSLCAVYWHFLLIVWIGLFLLLANT